MLWCIWRRRNDKVWEGEVQNVRMAVQLAREGIFQWQNARKCQKNSEQQQEQQQNISWQPPDQGYVKCNVDAALFSDQKCFGVGMCIRNSQGRFIKALSRWFECTPRPLEAEALGLKEAILWLSELGLSNVLIGLDCKLLVDGIVDGTKNQSEFGNIMSTCRSLLTHFPNFKISFARRQANFVAHTLARESKLYASRHVFDWIPSCITTTIMNERI